MDKNQHSHYFSLLALGALCLIMYFIVKPFLGPLILAAVFAFLFQPFYQKFLGILSIKGGSLSVRQAGASGGKKRESLAAFVATVLAIILIIIPLALLGTQIFKEASQLYQSLTNKDDGFEASIINLIDRARSVFPIPADFEIDFGRYARQGLEILIQNFGVVFASFAKILLNASVFLIAFYFFLKDGGKLKNYLVALIPLTDADNELIVSRLKSGVSAVVKGNLVIGLIQGALTGIGFAIFGVPNPALWGSFAVVSALIPGIGTALVITPAIIFLLFTGNVFGGIGLLAWGMTAVGLIDNLLGPKLVGRGMRLHPLAVFIAVLGGIAFFGPLGFLLGPLTASVCLALIDIYASLKARESKTA